jgi:hypothetical protein
MLTARWQKRTLLTERFHPRNQHRTADHHCNLSLQLQCFRKHTLVVMPTHATNNIWITLNSSGNFSSFCSSVRMNWLALVWRGVIELNTPLYTSLTWRRSLMTETCLWVSHFVIIRDRNIGAYSHAHARHWDSISRFIFWLIGWTIAQRSELFTAVRVQTVFSSIINPLKTKCICFT